MTPPRRWAPLAHNPPGGACALGLAAGGAFAWATLDKVAERSWWQVARPDGGVTALMTPQPGRAARAALTDDGALLLCAGRCGTTRGALWRWRPGAPAPDWALALEPAWISPEGDAALLREPDGALARWALDAEAPRRLGALPGEEPLRAQRRGALLPPPRVSPEGASALLLGAGGHLRVLDLRDGALGPSLLPEVELVRAVHAPKGEVLALDTEGTLWALSAAGAPLASMPSPPGFTPCPELLWPLSAAPRALLPCEEGGALCWDWSSGALLWALAPHEGPDGVPEPWPALLAVDEAAGWAWLCPMNHRALSLSLGEGAWGEALSGEEPLLSLVASPWGLLGGDQAGAALCWAPPA
jgi:hypothetical protein